MKVKVYKEYTIKFKPYESIKDVSINVDMDISIEDKLLEDEKEYLEKDCLKKHEH